MIFFICVACFESESDLTLGKMLNWAVVGCREHWELSESQASAAASPGRAKAAAVCKYRLGNELSPGISLGHKMGKLVLSSEPTAAARTRLECSKRGGPELLGLGRSLEQTVSWEVLPGEAVEPEDGNRAGAFMESRSVKSS